jgi:hypothetical protein
VHLAALQGEKQQGLIVCRILDDVVGHLIPLVGLPSGFQGVGNAGGAFGIPEFLNDLLVGHAVVEPLAHKGIQKRLLFFGDLKIGHVFSLLFGEFAVLDFIITERGGLSSFVPFSPKSVQKRRFGIGLSRTFMPGPGAEFPVANLVKI